MKILTKSTLKEWTRVHTLLCIHLKWKLLTDAWTVQKTIIKAWSWSFLEFGSSAWKLFQDIYTHQIPHCTHIKALPCKNMKLIKPMKCNLLWLLILLIRGLLREREFILNRLWNRKLFTTKCCYNKSICVCSKNDYKHQPWQDTFCIIHF